mmetsp:Transcript_11750/g.22340  ORF Transcript_11750/g.22340 Transcript_11750/m.22340 type:complete len:224 (+) Transcript_11750:511-1182(+)
MRVCLQHRPRVLPGGSASLPDAPRPVRLLQRPGPTERCGAHVSERRLRGAVPRAENAGGGATGRGGGRRARGGGVSHPSEPPRHRAAAAPPPVQALAGKDKARRERVAGGGGVAVWAGPRDHHRAQVQRLHADGEEHVQRVPRVSAVLDGRRHSAPRFPVPVWAVVPAAWSPRRRLELSKPGCVCEMEARALPTCTAGTLCSRESGATIPGRPYSGLESLSAL